ncbi:MAG TPA: pyridoxal phosphate-dependent aminotransferase [Candidatus Saccharimonadales bacterium]|jgi:aspartate aminotransferase|nr:pyridoxal phosphate-dependent aminotransferase [Candidatus Saccharimonadales bacterium]
MNPIAITPVELRLARRMGRLSGETAFEVLHRARELEAQGRDIVHLEIGEPDFDTPANITEVGIQAIRDGHTHYTPSAGILELREAAAEDIRKTRGIPCSSDEVVVVPGAKPTVFFTFMALVEEGDEVIYPGPGFPAYESLTNFMGARGVPIPLREENDFRLDPNELAGLITDRTRLLILNSPHNPTGGVLSQQDLRDIAEAIGDRNIMVLSDEIYSRLVYEGEHHSIASLPGWKDRTIILDGFSKTYAMTGWRLGYGVMRADLAKHFSRLMTNANSCTATFTQMAGVEGLRGDQTAVNTMCAEFRRRRDHFVKRLNQIDGFKCRVPAGAFYTFPNIRQTGRSSKQLAELLLEQAGVACLAGSAFGAHGEGYLRFSTANSFENLDKAADRITEWISKNKI